LPSGPYGPVLKKVARSTAKRCHLSRPSARFGRLPSRYAAAPGRHWRVCRCLRSSRGELSHRPASAAVALDDMALHNPVLRGPRSAGALAGRSRACATARGPEPGGRCFDPRNLSTRMRQWVREFTVASAPPFSFDRDFGSSTSPPAPYFSSSRTPQSLR
jgi:hypothetical protein